MNTPTIAQILRAAEVKHPDNVPGQLGYLASQLQLIMVLPNQLPGVCRDIFELCQMPGSGCKPPGNPPAAAMPQPGEQPAAPPVAESNSEASVSKPLSPGVAGSGATLLSAPCGAETRPEPKEPAAMSTGDGREFYPDKIAASLIHHGIIHACAWNDAGNFDGGRTYVAILAVAKDLGWRSQ